MQVDRYNHLLFPRDATAGNSSNNNPASTGKESASTAARGAAGALQAKPQQAGWGVQPDARVASRTESVVLKIQWPDGAVAKPKDIPLYTPGRRMPAGGDASTDNTSTNNSMAREHQLAVDRQAAAGGGAVTPLAVNKDGVLVVAKPSSQVEESQQQPEAQPDFVALAVSALREYRDDPERQRVSAQAQGPAPEAHWSALKGLQQFAAKLNVFA